MTSVILPTREQQIGLATVLEACAYLNISRETFYQLMNRGKVDTVKVNALRRVRWSELHRIAGEPLTSDPAGLDQFTP